MIWIPVEPAMIIQLRWMRFSGSVQDKEVCLMGQPECLMHLIQTWFGTMRCLFEILQMFFILILYCRRQRSTSLVPLWSCRISILFLIILLIFTTIILITHPISHEVKGISLFIISVQ